MSRLLALHYYTSRCITINKIPDIRLIDIESAVKLMVASEKAKDTSVENQKEWNQVPKFNGDNWVSFRNKFATLPRTKVGIRETTLDYVVRDDDGAQDGGLQEESIPDLSDPHIFSTQTTLKGPDFNMDNEKVYNYVSGFLQDTPGWNHIKKYEAKSNGRESWLALKEHYEG